MNRTQVALLDAVARRYSPKRFAETPIPEPVLRVIFEAARWAPSSRNRQPWRFLVTHRGTEPYERLFATLRPANQERAKGAPVLVLACAVEEDALGPNTYAWHDLGLACGQMVVQATALGVYIRFMAGFDKEQAQARFRLPETVRPVTVIVMGYPADALPAERFREPLSELVFEGEWGNPATWTEAVEF